MNLSASICHALCEGFSVREVPVGFAIKSSFDWFMGEPMTFYARIQDGRARYEDSGILINDLEGMGVDFDSESRRNVLSDLLNEHGVIFDEAESMFVTAWVPASQLASKTAPFLAFLSRVQDLLFLNKERIVSTFREDLLEAIEGRFSARSKVELGISPVDELPQSVADITVSFNTGAKLAIFPATSELKAYQAMLFASELEASSISNVTPFLVFEDFGSSKLSSNTRARTLNSSLQIAAWNGGRDGVLDKLEKFSLSMH